MAKKNLVLDMGNVLICFDTEKILRRNGITSGRDLQLFTDVIFSSDVWRGYDRGTVEKSAFLPLIEKLPERLRAVARDMIIDHVFAKEYMPPIPGTEELVRRAREKGYCVYLLSNAGQDYYEYSLGIPALKYFNGTFVSSDWKLLKPEREIYEAFLRHFSLDASECVFVDDVQANIDGAAAVGIDGVCFNASKRDLAELYEELKNKGIVLI